MKLDYDVIFITITLFLIAAICIRLLEFSPNVFTEFSEFSDKIILFLKKCCARTHYLLCERQRHYHSPTETQLTENTFKLILVHASMILQILWIRWIQWSSSPFRENSNVLKKISSREPPNRRITIIDSYFATFPSWAFSKDIPSLLFCQQRVTCSVVT